VPVVQAVSSSRVVRIPRIVLVVVLVLELLF